ncbi:hypothetical protein [Paenibacillus beijingensis]|uniref:hypothetical protein n=1 Tax=Paenibacillus beijingensis TaxID=1126833 RepID=UPI000697CDF4|nr:hypothetical protein [Paenibacillus beijingensis]
MNYRNYRNDSAAGGFQQPQSYQSPGPFPGLGGDFFGEQPTVPLGAPQYTQASALPVQLPEPAAAPVEVVAAESTKSGGLSLPNLTELKGLVDRMGGIDGILSTMTKVQKVVGNVQQMAPFVKMMFSAFGKGGGAKAATTQTTDDTEWKPRRRKKRRRPSTARGAARRKKTRRR